MNEKLKTRRPRPGRPIKRGGVADKPGLSSVLSARISTEVRARLEAEADRTGRSISQVAERWLDEASKGHASFLELVGGDAEVGTAVTRLVAIARAVRAANPETDMFPTALHAAWDDALLGVIVRSTPLGDWEARSREISDAWDACFAVLECIERAGTDDAVYQRALKPLRGPGGLLSGREISPSLYKVLLPPNPANAFAAGKQPDKTMLAALSELRDSGKTATPEIEIALERVNICVERAARDQDKFERAFSLGREVAAQFNRVDAPRLEPKP